MPPALLPAGRLRIIIIRVTASNFNLRASGRAGCIGRKRDSHTARFVKRIRRRDASFCRALLMLLFFFLRAFPIFGIARDIYIYREFRVELKTEGRLSDKMDLVAFIPSGDRFNDR